MPFDAARLPERLALLPAPTPWPATLCFRSVNALFVGSARSSVLTGYFSGRNGGRFNPPGSDPVCYVAATQTAASFEVEQEQLLLGMGRNADPPPRIIFGVSLRGARLLDLGNPMLCKQLGLACDESDLLMPSLAWKSLNASGLHAPTQVLGEAARAQGYDGIRYPGVLSTYVGSALPALHNVAVFMDPEKPAEPARRRVRLSLHDHGMLAP